MEAEFLNGRVKVLVGNITEQEVEAIVNGSGGLLEAARPGLVVVDTSTSLPGSTATIRAEFAKKGVSFIDARHGTAA